MSLFLGLSFIIAGLYLFKSAWAIIFLIGIILFTLWKKPASYQKILLISFGLLLLFILRIYLLSQSKGLPNVGLVFYRRENYYLLLTLKGRFYVSASNHHYEVGDLLKFHAEEVSHHFYTYEQQFDFGNYLENKGVYRSLKLINITPIITNPIRITPFKNHLLDRYQGTTKELLKALLFHERANDSILFQKFNSLELAYLFGASGLHINALIHLIKKLLKRWIEKEELIFLFGTMLPLTILMILLPSHLAIYRLGVIASLQFLNQKYFKKSFSYLTILSFAAFIFLFINPYLAYQPAFYLSFGLLFWMSLTRSLTRRMNKVKKLCVGGFFAYLFMLPYVLSTSYQLHLFTPIFTLILAPILGLIYVIGLLSLLLPFLIPLLSLGTKVLFALIDFFVKIDVKFIFGLPSMMWVIIFYLLILTALYAFTLGHQPLKIVTVIGLILLMTPFQHQINHLYTAAIYFINVGQGDAILVRNERKTMLIDTGGSLYQDLATRTLIPFFYSLQITHLDAVWISHDDYDHAGALSSLQEHFPIAQILSSDAVFNLGDLEITNLNYEKGREINQENDHSAVLYFSLLGKKILLMGDASTKVEEELLMNYPTLDIDIIKLGHHGALTSSSLEFLHAISPQLAIISVGRNHYGHPSKEVISRLEALQIPYLRTDEVGTGSVSFL